MLTGSGPRGGGICSHDIEQTKADLFDGRGVCYTRMGEHDLARADLANAARTVAIQANGNAKASAIIANAMAYDDAALAKSMNLSFVDRRDRRRAHSG